MASFTSSGWPSGATVTVYARDAFDNQTGSSVTSATATAAGVASFTGLADSGKYVATDGSRTVRFGTPAVTPGGDGGQPLGGIPGLLAPDSRGMSSATVTAVANRCWVMRFVPPRDMTFTALRHALTTAASVDDQVDLGILDAAGNRLVSTGAVSGKTNGATGAKATAVTATTCRRDTPYFAALAYGAIGGTAAVLGGMTSASFGLAGLLVATPGTADSRIMAGFKDASFPIPAQVAPASCTLTGGAVPAVGLME